MALDFVNKDRATRNEEEVAARREVVQLCRAMLSGELSYFEGALRVAPLRFRVGVKENDPDFTAFVAIYSDTDRLPPQHVRHRWSPEALKRLQPEFEQTEVWGRKFAAQSCENLVTRFSGSLAQARLASVAVDIIRFADESPPGWVECVLTDAHGQLHSFVEKVPVVSLESLGPLSVYPAPGTLSCEVTEFESTDGRKLVHIDTERPWGVESTTGLTRFVVPASLVSQ